jgi:hypothetical protein
MMPNGGSREYDNGYDVSYAEAARFLGWFLSEGSFDGDTGLVIAQKKRQNIDSIVDACKPFGTPTVGKDGVKLSNANLSRWIREHCLVDGDGRTCYRWMIPDLVRHGTREVIEAFLHAFLLGDGYMHKGRMYFITTSEQLRDGLVELLLKCGNSCNWHVKHKAGSVRKIDGRLIRSTRDCYCVFEYSKPTPVYVSRGRSEIKRWVEPVWFMQITGETRLLLSTTDMRRPFWTHNGGVTDILLDHGYTVAPVNFAQAAVDSDHYANAAAEMWFNFATKIDDVEIPGDVDLIEELTGRREGRRDSKGRRTVEKKDDFIKRVGRSPDKADALLLAFYEPSDIITDMDYIIA